MGRLFLFAGAMIAVVFSCASPDRDNTLDPKNTPFIRFDRPQLENGRVLLEWRAFFEPSSLPKFRVTKLLADDQVDLGTVSGPSGDSGWQTFSLVDTSVVAGVIVTYVVSALDEQGDATAAERETFSIQGARLTSAVDYVSMEIRLSWVEPPDGTVGYRIGRSVAGEPEETVYQTSDVGDRSFTDRPVVGGEPHTYVLYSEFSNGRSVSSDPESVTILKLSSDASGSPVTGYHQYLNFSTPGAAGMLNLSSTSTLSRVYSGTAQNRIVTDSEILIDDFNPLTLDVSPGYGAEDKFIVTGQRLSRQQAFVSSHPQTSTDFPESALVVEWERSSAPDSRVPITWAGPYGSPGKIVVLEGNQVRVFSEKLELLNQQEVPMEGAIGIEYVDNALWIAYPDALLRSTGDPASDSVLGPWEPVDLPGSTEIASMTRMQEDKIVLLDARNSRIYVLSAGGELLLSLAAPGDNLAAGDVFYHWRSGTSWIFLVDGAGLRFVSELLPSTGTG